MSPQQQQNAAVQAALQLRAKLVQQHEQARAQQAGSTKWKEAKDPVTGASYYYNAETKETVWEKPAELHGTPPAPEVPEAPAAQAQ